MAKDNTQPNAQPADQPLDAPEAQLQRLAADFANYRRRTEAERQAVVALAEARTLLELTPVLDNFRRASEHLPVELKDNNWVIGVLHVEHQLEQILAEFGLAKLKTSGEPFNPQFHEAIEHETSQTVPANHITVEIESGYRLNDQILKPAKVKVSSGPAPDPTPLDKNVKFPLQ